MRKRIAVRLGVAGMCLFLSVPVVMAQSQSAAGLSPSEQEILRISKEVRKQIVTLPQYGVFDHLHFAIKGDDTVVLYGQASRPTLKSAAGKAVKAIKGVREVDNQIEVLPLSNQDDRLRAAVYASIYRYPALQRYTSNRAGPRVPSVARAAGGITNDPPIGYHAIHIIVNKGNVALFGVVDSPEDAAIAGMRANSVPGVFSVENDLEVPSRLK